MYDLLFSVLLTMFLLLTSLFFYATLIGLASSDELYDAIVGQELIGSHFGIPFFNATFDYVVIGGGTAGLTIATRLAQNSTNTVAVIEAGGFYEFDNGNLSAIPGGAGYWVGAAPQEKNPLIDWGIYTEPMVVSMQRHEWYCWHSLLIPCRGWVAEIFFIPKERPWEEEARATI